jgi:hypothetical protein
MAMEVRDWLAEVHSSAGTPLLMSARHGDTRERNWQGKPSIHCHCYKHMMLATIASHATPAAWDDASHTAVNASWRPVSIVDRCYRLPGVHCG